MERTRKRKGPTFTTNNDQTSDSTNEKQSVLDTEDLTDVFATAQRMVENEKVKEKKVMVCASCGKMKPNGGCKPREVPESQIDKDGYWKEMK